VERNRSGRSVGYSPLLYHALSSHRARQHRAEGKQRTCRPRAMLTRAQPWRMRMAVLRLRTALYATRNAHRVSLRQLHCRSTCMHSHTRTGTCAPSRMHTCTHRTHTHAPELRTGAHHSIGSMATGRVRCPAQSTTRAYCVRSHTVRGVPDGSLPVSTAFDGIRCQQSTASTCPSQRGPNASRATTPCPAGLHERNMPHGIPGRPYSTISHAARYMVAHAACDKRHAWRREYWHGGADQR
jgi:hypothetical protein